MKVRKYICLLLVLTGILSLAGCGMKECKCLASDKLYLNDSIDARTDTVFTVYNYTKTDCEQFNEDEKVVMDSVTYILHKVICEEN